MTKKQKKILDYYVEKFGIKLSPEDLLAREYHGLFLAVNGKIIKFLKKGVYGAKTSHIEMVEQLLPNLIAEKFIEDPNVRHEYRRTSKGLGALRYEIERYEKAGMTKSKMPNDPLRYFNKLTGWIRIGLYHFYAGRKEMDVELSYPLTMAQISTIKRLARYSDGFVADILNPRTKRVITSEDIHDFIDKLYKFGYYGTSKQNPNRNKMKHKSNSMYSRRKVESALSMCWEENFTTSSPIRIDIALKKHLYFSGWINLDGYLLYAIRDHSYGLECILRELGEKEQDELCLGSDEIIDLFMQKTGVIRMKWDLKDSTSRALMSIENKITEEQLYTIRRIYKDFDEFNYEIHCHEPDMDKLSYGQDFWKLKKFLDKYDMIINSKQQNPRRNKKGHFGIYIGFTGNRLGMTSEQRETVFNLLKELSPRQVHHGDCEGSDAEFHDMAEELGIKIIIHPPVDERYRAFKKGTILEAKDYLERNDDIVDDTDILIATPQSEYEKIRSGTWATIRYATKKSKKIKIVLPDGTIEENLYSIQARHKKVGKKVCLCGKPAVAIAHFPTNVYAGLKQVTELKPVCVYHVAKCKKLGYLVEYYKQQNPRRIK